MTIAQLLLDRADDSRDGLRTTERTWSWSEVVAESANRAALAQSRRVDGPFHIGVLLDNVPEYLFWLGGAALSGAAVVGINSTRRGAELEHEITQTDCQLIVTDAAGHALLDGLDLGAATDRIVRIDDPSYPAQLAATPGAIEAAADVSPDTLFLLLFTSGTTGRSKSVICSQGRLANSATNGLRLWGINAADVSYCCMPLFHGNALMSLWAPTLAAGGCVALPVKFSASRFLDDVQQLGATYFTYVGKAIAYVLATPERPDDRDNQLIRGFGTEASPDDRAEFDRRFGCRLIEGYGSSEGAGLVMPSPDAPTGALGRPLGPDVCILDPDTMEPCAPAELDEFGRVLNPDEAIGEIVGMTAAEKFEGYYKNADADAERTRNGWYWTGDLGYLDADGFIYFAGRKGDWVRVDGENLSALQVELVLRRHPDVVLAGAYAVPDERSGDQVMVAIELRVDSTFDPVTFAGFLAAQPDLAPKSVPRFVRVSPALPTTGSNKLVKRSLQLERWNGDDPVWRWAGRGAPEYTSMSDTDRGALDDAIVANGRSHLLR